MRKVLVTVVIAALSGCAVGPRDTQDERIPLSLEEPKGERGQRENRQRTR